MNLGLFTCEANALPLSYNPADTFCARFAEQAHYYLQGGSLDIKSQWKYRGLNAGLSTYEGNALPLSYTPADTIFFSFAAEPRGAQNQ